LRNVKRTIRASAKGVIADLAPPLQWIEPELCKLVTRIPAGDNWAHEIKFDGFRMHARIVSGAAALLTRNGLDWTAKYPDIAAAIGALNWAGRPMSTANSARCSRTARHHSLRCRGMGIRLASWCISRSTCCISTARI
jgi:hypothetical protein